ncbi:Regulatory protein AtoC [Koleobacter methoxysyntrophicus]|uniref:Stage 0 sporulation protein A homolog n=2 Tax=Koleobacter methoxysyntrophicus TaxID=2751313 RepID=A0A8A0RM90_9FIRM|nr:Regulatory protein AtoC [Koleobacter methoxysyntrophicus]
MLIMPEAKVLLVDDEAKIREILKLVLEKEGYQVHTSKNGSEALSALENEYFDVMITDLKMPKMDGLELMREIKQKGIKVNVVFITAYADIKDAVEAIKLGAFDYLEKNFKMEELLSVIKEAVKEQKMIGENESLKKKLAEHDSFFGIIGESPKIKEIKDLIIKIANSQASVLLTGESGTGKEMFARAIHMCSKRKNKPFVAINCAALPQTLLESELFGYEKGAFTGALKQKKGKFEQANEGTIFLDEIGEMNIQTQSKLLRVLQEREYERVGGLETIKIDIRVITATNRDLEEAIKAGDFREDLYYRINVIPIHIPPLRERREDIPLLAEYFLKKFNVDYKKNIELISMEVIDIFMEYDWPGNIRELKNVIERAVAIAEPDVDILMPHHLRPQLICPKKEKDLLEIQDGLSLAEFEKYYIYNTLKKVNWNKSKAAQILGINRQTLYNKMRELSIENKKRECR